MDRIGWRPLKVSTQYKYSLREGQEAGDEGGERREERGRREEEMSALEGEKSKEERKKETVEKGERRDEEKVPLQPWYSY